MSNTELIAGISFLVIGILGLFINETKWVAPFLIGFSLPTIIRGIQKVDDTNKKRKR